MAEDNESSENIVSYFLEQLATFVIFHDWFNVKESMLIQIN